MKAARYIPVSTAFPTALPLRQRILILTLATIAHGVLLSQPWLVAPGLAGSAPRELSVSIIKLSPSRPVLASPSGRALAPAGEHKRPDAGPQPAMPPSQHDDEAGPMTTASPDSNSEPAQAVASGLPDREPDYRAAYLNNPQPEYPLAARRMGWQGRVVLNVEVLADGTPGEVVVQQSSGREILDSAAVRSVRGWRFVPARQGGYAVAQRLLVPVRFNLEMIR